MSSNLAVFCRQHPAHPVCQHVPSQVDAQPKKPPPNSPKPVSTVEGGKSDGAGESSSIDDELGDDILMQLNEWARLGNDFGRERIINLRWMVADAGHMAVAAIIDQVLQEQR